MDNLEIKHDVQNSEFYVVIDGVKAHVAYVIADGGLDIRHTIVPEALGGRGIASALVKAAYDYARSQELVPVATCTYAAVWLERHPEYRGCKSTDWHDGACAL